MSTEKYWVGPYGVLVPDYTDRIVASDGYNTQYKDGSVTERGCLNPKPMNQEIYKKMFSSYQ